jgi:hypothetical protein
LQLESLFFDGVAFFAELNLVETDILLKRNLIKSLLGKVLWSYAKSYLNQCGKSGVTHFFHLDDFRDGHILAFGNLEVTELDCLIKLIHLFLENFCAD